MRHLFYTFRYLTLDSLDRFSPLRVAQSFSSFCVDCVCDLASSTVQMVIWYVNAELHHVEFADTLISIAPHTAKISVVHHFRLMQYGVITIIQCIREEMEVC